MSTISTAQSNAYNFSSFVQNSVDPRTGQYTLAIVLPELVGNDQMGPALTPRLRFNPMNQLDAGFGTGWGLNSSQYVPATNLLTMQTGETLMVTGNDMGDGTGLAFEERKLKSFHLHQEDAENWRLEYKTGLVEFLQLKGPSDRGVALPVRIEAASGHWITLDYEDFNETPCLKSIVDGNGLTLLTIEYETGSVKFNLYPDIDSDTQPSAQYEVKLEYRGPEQQRVPTQVLLPSGKGAGWTFDYYHFEYDEDLEQYFALLKEITTPFGAVETLEYWTKENGHRFPNDARPPLPRVKRHAVDPRFGQPEMVTTYEYTDNNYLGRGAGGITWRDDGLDNLYQFTGSDFEYGSTASHWLKAADDDSPGDGKVVRTVTTRYNRFHLMTRETEVQNGCVQEIYTEYHEQEGVAFKNQPAYFQLPYKVTQRWRLENENIWPREEFKTTTFDEHCNILEEVEYSGIRTVYTYYPITGETEIVDGKEQVACPADPQHFKRRIKYKTTYPAPDDGQAAILRSHYRYKAIAPLDGARKTFGETVIKEQRTLQLASTDANAAATLLQHTELTYLEKPDTPLLHMRPDVVRQTMKHGDDPLKDRTTTSTSFYSLINGDDGKQSLLQIRHTVQGHDLRQRTLHSAVSRYTGQVMRQQDTNGVYTHFYYDAVRRKVRETVAPGTSFEASCTYDYHLSVEASQPTQVTTNVQKVVSTLLLDGLNRSVGEKREIDTANDPDNPVRKTFTVATKQYDSLGRQCAETVHDNLDNNESLALTSRFEYDDWGNLSKTIGPNGVIYCQQRSPFGKDGDIIETWQERADEAALKQPLRRQLQKVEFNRFGKPVYEQRIDLDGQEVGRRDYLYEGLGRCVTETRTQRDPLSTPAEPKPALRHAWKFSYDVWGRMMRNERPDQSALIRRFSDFTSETLTTRLELEGDATPICTRTFDGLGRMSTLTVGPRIERYDYQEGRTLVHQHHRTSKRTHTYSYQPEVTTLPTRISTTLTSEQGQLTTSLDNPSFAFERPDASITSASNPEGKRTYRYTDQGYLLQESWTGETANNRINDDHTIRYRHSLLGRTLERSSDDTENTIYRYDPQGRVAKILQGTLEASFEYDEDGRVKKTETVDQYSKRKVTCEQQYDCFGREVQRTLTLDNGTVEVLEQKWRDDDQLHIRTRHQSGVLLLEEIFAYDDLDRLERVDYSGSQLPRNTAGRAMTSQVMRFNERDQLTRCSTSFADGETDSARFTYKTDGSCQLQRVTHTLQPDYPADQVFEYDKDGNMRNDEWGRKLHYDDRSRLTEVRASDDKEVLARYRYDGHDHLVGTRYGEAAEVQRRYQGYRLSATLEQGVLTRYLYDGEAALAMQVDGQPHDNRLLLTDAAYSVIGEYAESGLHNTRYSVYGERTLDKDDEEEKSLASLVAFKGEVREPVFGWYMLGRGYRAYSPGLMCFNSPDSLAPEQSGLNPYLYVLGNPVNWRDPTGHYAEGNNDPLPPFIDPMKEARQNFLEKWQNVGFALIGAVVGAAFMFAFPPAGIGIVFAVAGGVVTAAGLGLAVAGTLTDNNTMAIAGIGLTALGGGLMSLASVGTRVSEAFRTPRKSVSSEGGSRRASVPTASDANNDSVNVVNPVQVAPENIPLATTDTQTNVVRRHSVSEISITENPTAPAQQTPQGGPESTGSTGSQPPAPPRQRAASTENLEDLMSQIRNFRQFDRHVDIRTIRARNFDRREFHGVSPIPRPD
ncbi:RHS repeat-associated core domain-containing protein [Pseudomonas asiatica]|uniref:RHS repeat domain-containing protein n=1 Tax=Pseudomonas asiatica TaxID=2219225 RepID=UPI00345D5EF9